MIVEKEEGENLNEYETRLREAYERGSITREAFFENTERECSRLYLSRDNPRAQSGHGSDMYRWRNVRWMILEPILQGGTFIDIGSANGHLIETLDRWMKSTDVHVEFFGLEISERLHELAKKRLPGFANRLFHGNVFDWLPQQRFTYVYTMIYPDFPMDMRRELIHRLYHDYLSAGGTLILGPWSAEDGYEDEILSFGYEFAGYVEKTVPPNNSEVKRVVWIDK